MGYKPKVRFNGFTNDWEQRKCKDIFDKVGNPVETKEDETYREIGIRSHGKGIFYKDEVTSKDLGNKRVFWIEPDCFILNIVFAWERAVARTTENELGMIASHRFPMYKPKAGVVDLDYITKFFTTDKGKDILEMASPGGAGRNKTLGQKEFADSKLWLSSYDEQKKIGKLIDELDKAITLHQCKCDETKELKKYMLQKMFPKNGERKPEIRFADFTDDWEQRKLSEIAGVYDGVHQTPDYQDEGIMFLSVENISTLTSEKYISEEAYDRDYKVRPEKGDILMTRIGDVGTPNVVETSEKLAYYVSLALLKPKGIDSYFLNNAIQSASFQHGLRERTLLTAIPMKINKDEIGKVDLLYPKDPDEQRKIGESFRQIDNLITLHQRKYEELITLKQFFLQNMF